MKKKDNILTIENLNIFYNEKIHAVDNFNLEVERGTALGVIGESGSGKTSLLKSIMGLIRENAKVTGNIKYNGKELVGLSEKECIDYRWTDISIVFQNSARVLNPKLTIESQLMEVLNRSKTMTKEEKIFRIEELFNKMDLDIKWLKSYPLSLSGGMIQKVLIIMAMLLEPPLILVDEPTTAIESIGKNKIIENLQILKDENISMLVVSHDLNLIEKLCDNIAVTYEGKILEKNNVYCALKKPRHPYTRDLIMSSADVNPYRDLWGISRNTDIKSNGCPYYNSCTQRIDECLKKFNTISDEVGNSCIRGGIVELMNCKNLSKTFNSGKKKVDAIKNISISIDHGEVVGIIGKSGSGKTTLGNILSGLSEHYNGEITINKEEFKIDKITSNLHGVQMVFQDPSSAINPMFTVREAILEPILINKIYDAEKSERELDKYLEAVDLYRYDLKNSKMRELSGGQIQRVAIARALIMKPKLLIADEITASLDISNKVNIMRILKGLQNKEGFSLVYITHDLRLAQKVADRILVMNYGEVIESALTRDLFENPKAEYTKELINSM